MSARINVVKATFDDFTERSSVDALLANITDDVVFKNAIPEEAPFGGEFHGRKGVLEYFERVDSVLEPSCVTVTGYFEAADQVVVLGNERLRIKASGQEFPSSWCTVFTFRGEQISRIDVIEDHSPFFAAWKAETGPRA